MYQKGEADGKTVYFNGCVFCKFFFFGFIKIAHKYINSAAVLRHNYIVLVPDSPLSSKGSCGKETKCQVKKNNIQGGDPVASLRMAFTRHD